MFFVNCPDIINKIGKKYKIIIPSTVLEELDKLKIKEGVDKTILSKAAKNISVAFTQKYSCMEDANISLLPNGFDRRNPDCKILSVALKHSEENPILLTSDNMCKSKGIRHNNYYAERVLKMIDIFGGRRDCPWIHNLS